MKIAWVITGAGILKNALRLWESSMVGRFFFLESRFGSNKDVWVKRFLAKRNIHVINDEKASSPSCGALRHADMRFL